MPWQEALPCLSSLRIELRLLLSDDLRRWSGLVAQVCAPSYSGGQGRRITNSTPAWATEKVQDGLGNQETMFAFPLWLALSMEALGYHSVCLYQGPVFPDLPLRFLGWKILFTASCMPGRCYTIKLYPSILLTKKNFLCKGPTWSSFQRHTAVSAGEGGEGVM